MYTQTDCLWCICTCRQSVCGACGMTYSVDTEMHASSYITCSQTASFTCMQKVLCTCTYITDCRFRHESKFCCNMTLMGQCNAIIAMWVSMQNWATNKCWWNTPLHGSHVCFLFLKHVCMFQLYCAGSLEAVSLTDIFVPLCQGSTTYLVLTFLFNACVLFHLNAMVKGYKTVCWFAMYIVRYVH